MSLQIFFIASDGFDTNVYQEETSNEMLFNINTS